MEIKTAGEKMIPLKEYPYIYDTDTLKKAIEVIENAKLRRGSHRSLPRVLLVFDQLDVLVGMVRRRDIMRGLEPEFLVVKPLEYRKKLFDIEIDPNLSEFSLSEFSFNRIIKDVRRQAGRKVTDVMIPLKCWIDFKDHLMKAIYEMVSNNLSLLPVVRDKKVVGVLRSVDVFQEVAAFVLEKAEEN